MIKIVVDAFGGDNSPEAIVKGAICAVNSNKDIHIILAGEENKINTLLRNEKYNAEQISILNATDIINNNESPTEAIRFKKDSSLVKALDFCKENDDVAGIVSAGSTGAVLTGAFMKLGRIKGIYRPALCPVLPTMDGGTVSICDCGANMDSRPTDLVQFAQMGSIYMKHIVGIENPRVAIVNVGAEEEKGNALVKETFPLLKACPNINFIGSVEARDIPAGAADVIVCDAFVGNVILKLYEGTAAFLMKQIKGAMTSSPISTIGAAMVKPKIKEAVKEFDSSNYGGAPLLGINGLVAKVHGSSKASEVKNAVTQCMDFSKQHIKELIAENITTGSEE